MSTDSPRVHPCTRLLLLPVLTLALVVLGCGPSDEATDEEWETSPEATTSAPEYRLDRLQAENRRMQDQLDALVAENRSLRARIADLETRLSEATSAAQAEASLTASGRRSFAHAGPAPATSGRHGCFT